MGTLLLELLTAGGASVTVILLKAVVAAALDSMSWRSVGDFWDEIVDRLTGLKVADRVAMAFIGIGAFSLVISNRHYLWVGGPQQTWWESFHLEVGAGLLMVGLIDTLIMSRLESR